MEEQFALTFYSSEQVGNFGDQLFENLLKLKVLSVMYKICW